MKKTAFVKQKEGKDKVIGRPIKCNRQVLRVLKTKKEYAEVVFIADLHYGSPQANVKKFKAMLDYCLEKNIYTLFMGDIMEAATKTSIAAGWAEQEYILQKQYEDIVEFLTPLAEKKLILGYLMGN